MMRGHKSLKLRKFIVFSAIYLIPRNRPAIHIIVAQYFHAAHRLITTAVHATVPSKQILVATEISDESIKEEEKAGYLLCVTRGQSCSCGAL